MELWNRRQELDIELLQIGTNLSRTDEYKDRFLAFAKENKIDLLERDEDIQECDFLISVQYHNILKSEQIQKARKLAINLHMAPLPEYRGCNQFSFAILDQKEEFGTSIHVMDPQIDHGDILFQTRFPISSDIWVEELHTKTETASLELFRVSLADIFTLNFTAIPQSDLESKQGSSLHYRHEINAIKKLQLDWPEEKILRHIRATYMPGFPGPYFMIDGQKVEVKIP